MKLKLISEYMELTREERRVHLDLDELCLERGGKSTFFRGLLADYLGTIIPENREAHLCHACHNAKCSNPKHLYWGSAWDNIQDQKENGTFTTLYERTKAKYGEQYIKDHAKQMGQKHGGSNRYTQEQIDQFRSALAEVGTARGYKTKLAEKLGLSHTQVRRLINTYGHNACEANNGRKTKICS